MKEKIKIENAWKENFKLNERICPAKNDIDKNYKQNITNENNYNESWIISCFKV